MILERAASIAIVRLVIVDMFLAIEGPKGVGKTTLLSALRQRISDSNANQVILTKEPTPAFDLGRESRLLGADLARAIAEDRAAHVTDMIKPALEAGKAVACDRYILSSLVFHTSDGVPPAEVWRLNQSFPLPDVNVIISASADVLRDRRARRQSLTRLEAESDPVAEMARYVEFGQDMQDRGVPLKIISNETSEQLEQAVEWLMRSMRDGLS